MRSLSLGTTELGMARAMCALPSDIAALADTSGKHRVRARSARGGVSWTSHDLLLQGVDAGWVTEAVAHVCGRARGVLGDHCWRGDQDAVRTVDHKVYLEISISVLDVQEANSNKEGSDGTWASVTGFVCDAEVAV